MRGVLGNFRLRARVTMALALSATGTALFVLLGVLWVIHDIVDPADERELRSATTRHSAIEIRSGIPIDAAAMSAVVVATIPAGSGTPWRAAIARRSRHMFVVRLRRSEEQHYNVEQFSSIPRRRRRILQGSSARKIRRRSIKSFRKTVVDSNKQECKTIVGLEGGVSRIGHPRHLPLNTAGSARASVGRVRPVLRTAVLRTSSRSGAASTSSSHLSANKDSFQLPSAARWATRPSSK